MKTAFLINSQVKTPDGDKAAVQRVFPRKVQDDRQETTYLVTVLTPLGERKNPRGPTEFVFNESDLEEWTDDNSALPEEGSNVDDHIKDNRANAGEEDLEDDIDTDPNQESNQNPDGTGEGTDQGQGGFKQLTQAEKDLAVSNQEGQQN